MDFIILSRDGMQVTAEARSLRRQKTKAEELVWTHRPGEGDKLTNAIGLTLVRT